MTARWSLQPDVPTPTDALAPLLAMQNATTAEDAHNLAMAAVMAGASGQEAQQAINEWAALQARQVQQVFAAAPRRDCCTGIHRDHQEIAAAMERHPAGKGLPPCKCSHPESDHGTDRSNRPTCFGSVVCGCTTFRPNPNAIPARFDERYDPSPEPIDRSIQ